MKNAITKFGMLISYVILGTALFCFLPGMKAEAAGVVISYSGGSLMINGDPVQVGDAPSYGLRYSEEGGTKSLTIYGTSDTYEIGDSVTSSYQINVLSGVTVSANEGYIFENYGTVVTNAAPGTVSKNYGTVESNNSVLTENHGLVEVSDGTISDNYGLVKKSTGTVTNNRAGGRIKNNDTGAEVANNYGSVYENNGIVSSNHNVVERNNFNVYNNFSDGIVYLNNAGGRVHENRGGSVYGNAGTVSTNNGSVSTERCPGHNYDCESDYDELNPSGAGGHSKSSRKNRKHTDSSADYKYVEIDGQLVYGGLIDGNFASVTTMIPASAYPKFNDWLVKKLTTSLDESESQDKLSIRCSVWNSFPEKVMQALNENQKDVELIYKADDGNLYCITIPAGTNVMQYVDENGYCGLAFLGQKLGQLPYTE